MRIFHIAPDEKFINSIHWQFEEIFPDQNAYRIILPEGAKKLNYVKVKKNVSIVEDRGKSLQIVLDEIKGYDLVVLHGLKFFQSRIVLKSKASTKFLWVFWGGEIYDNSRVSGSKPIGPKTKNKFVRPSIIETLKKIIRPIFYYFNYRASPPEVSILKAAKKIQYIATPYKEEVDFLKDFSIIDEKALHVTLTYFPADFIFKGIEDICISGQNILLGNSASLTNNHLEAFDVLKQLDLSDRKLIVPLSYGNNIYAREIDEIGRDMFCDNFKPVMKFMPLMEYNQLMSGCNIVVMNHYRQQAFGNIVAMLWMGAKVYLNESNTLYWYLKRIAVHVYSINKELVVENENVFEELNSQQIASNRNILKREMDFETIKKNLKDRLTAIIHEH